MKHLCTSFFEKKKLAEDPYAPFAYNIYGFALALQTVGDDEKVNDGTDGKDDVMEDNEKVEDEKQEDVEKVEDAQKVETDEKVEDERKDNDEKVDDDEKVEDAKVEDVKIEVEAKLEDGVARVDDVEVDLKLKDLKVKVKDEKTVGDVKANDDNDDNDDFQLYNTPPKGNYGRRVRKPKKDDSYTNPSLSKMPKTKDPMKVNHLQKFDDELLHKVKAWLDDPKTDNSTTDLHTVQAKKEVLVRVVTRLTCCLICTQCMLYAPIVQEIDAFCHLLRKRISCYPKTYKNTLAAIGDCVLSDRIRRLHRDFIKDPAKFPVDEFKDYYMGAPHRYMPEWSTIDDVYMPVNINQKHWILCVARLQKYRIDVYDCDAYLYKNLDPYLKPFYDMIPCIFAKTITPGERVRYPNFNFEGPLQPMTYKRFPHPKVKTAAAKVGEVPRATESGDCGVFTLMYMEHLTANQPVHNVTSENMGFFRQKMAVRLFHQIMEP
ncbi:uncharacterized protein LOC124939471 [Impatiens glandulifera]|uniref:uncharacterized protein LOC124939471 n=1 Tax=Impatiens glandulifera TaxID=253017 RepID=UPI001FB0F7E4|nr:uncharacterized protein LOC124939471 [Impatiens glandulifera]